jgi:rhodanese-related sulfurtransferase
VDLKAFQLLEFINNRLSNLEKNIARLDEKVEFSLALQRNHLIRIKNNESIDDSIILYGNPYNDLSPQQAHHIFHDPDRDFILLDVCADKYKRPFELSGALKIPLEHLQQRYVELGSKTLPTMIISERGLRSIQACEILIKRGYYNVNNISGGYSFFPEETSYSTSVELNEG